MFALRFDRRRGFTLVELLIVMSIIGVLVALTMPAINSARESGRRAVCENNLHQLSEACQQHEAQWHYFPSGGSGGPGDPTVGPAAARSGAKQQPGSWLYNILPFIDQKDLHDMPAASRPQTVLPILICPTRHRVKQSLNGYAMTDYAGNAGSQAKGTSPSLPWPDGVIYQSSAVSTAQIKDGLAYTYLIGEEYMPLGLYDATSLGWDSGCNSDTIRFTAATAPPAPANPASPPAASTLLQPAQDQNTSITSIFGSAHPAGFHMGFCDGRTMKLSYAIDPVVHAYLGGRADGEPTDSSKFAPP